MAQARASDRISDDISTKLKAKNLNQGRGSNGLCLNRTHRDDRIADLCTKYVGLIHPRTGTAKRKMETLVGYVTGSLVWIVMTTDTVDVR